MWWKRFLESDEALSILPEDKLYQINKSAKNQLTKMQDRESSLQNQINDVSFEICKVLSTDNELDISKGYMSKSAEEIRLEELKTTFNNLQYESELIEEEILTQETMLYHLTFAKQKNISNLQLKKLVSMLTSYACLTEDINERDSCVLCLDLLSGNTKILKMKINQNNIFFLRKSKDLTFQLNDLIAKSADIVKQIHQLQEHLEDTLHKSDLIGPLLPRIKAQLKLELKEFGDTKSRLISTKKTVETLISQRDDLQNDCSTLSAQFLMKPVDGGLTKEENQEKINLKQKYMNLDILRNQLIQKHQLMESQLNGRTDLIKEMDDETNELEKQSKILKNAIEEQKWKFQKLKEANVSFDDFQSVYNSSKRMGLEDLEATLLQKEEHLKLIERRKQNMKIKTEKLIEQEGKYDDQIKNLKELLEAAEFAD
ncbi:hypothetical protein M9Y10_034268 [Tritrichomonas musculus]|uniref:Uncharacterized protein n=1 Tax=Tritrichomonas musculus TaxID=1915356 RepID=A0ABR2KEM0_9EUKA